MKQSLFVLVTLVVSIVSGCGGTEWVDEQDVLAQSESALSTCSTTCANGNTISCQGASCSSVDGQKVTCDGVSSFCGLIIDPDPIPLCRSANSCANVDGTSCSAVGSTRTCCITATTSGSCRCRSPGIWSCPVIIRDPGPFDPHPDPGTGPF